MISDNWFVYILRMNDDSLYTGATYDLKRRIETHLSGKGSKYVRAKLPIKEVYAGEMMTKSEALKLEYKIKQLNKKDKINTLFENSTLSS
jgi:putative endonuclease